MRSNDRLCLCTIMSLLVLMVGAVQALAAAPGQGDCPGPDPDRTIAACTSMLQQSGQLSPRVKVAALNHRGVAYVRNRDYDRAIADYDAALQIAPNHASTYNFHGIAYRLKGDHDRAIADHDAEVRLAPQTAPPYMRRGVTYEAMENYEKALADYRQGFARGAVGD